MKRKKFSAFWFFLLTTFVIVAFPTILSICLLHNSVSYLETQTTARRVRQKEEVERLVNGSYMDAYSLAYRVALNTQVRSYAISRERDSLKEYEIFSYLKSIVSSGETYSNCFIYFPQYDRIISMQQASDRVNYLEENYNRNKNAVDQLLDCEEDKGIVSVISAESGKRMAFFVRTITNNTGTVQPSKVFVEIDLSYLAETMALLLPENDLCLVASGEFPLLLAGEMPDGWQLDDLYEAVCEERKLENWQSVEMLNSGKSGMDLYYLEGNTSSWRYYFHTFYMAGLEIVGCILISGFLSLYFSNYHTKKLKKIILSLKGEDESRSQVLVNEYEQINTYVDSYKENYQDIKELAQSYRQTCQNLYMRNILSGTVLNRRSIQETLQLYEIDLPYANYEIILLHAAANVLGAEEQEDELNNEVEIRVMANMIRQEILGWLPVEDKVFLLEIHGNYVCILNFEKATSENEKYSKDLAENILQIMRLFGVSNYTYQVSGIFTGAEKLAQVYQMLLQEANAQAIMRTPEQSDEKQMAECVQQCLDIIREEYSSKELSTDYIAGKLNVSRSYLSSLFKQQIGIGMLEYIHRYRINAFKQKIQENPDLHLHELAEQIGFGNQASLIRVFKKIEGITPGQYRDEILQHQNGGVNGY